MTLTEILAQVKLETKRTSLVLSDITPILNDLQGHYIQPKAKVHLTSIPTISVVSGTAGYSISGASASIYEIRWLTETISGVEYRLDPDEPLLPEGDFESHGVRIWGDTLYFQPKPTSSRTIKVYADKILTTLDSSTASQVPDIPTTFHWLYVLGCTARIGRREDEGDFPETRDYWAEFLAMLDDLENRQERRTQARTRRIRGRRFF